MIPRDAILNRALDGQGRGSGICFQQHSIRGRHSQLGVGGNLVREKVFFSGLGYIWDDSGMKWHYHGTQFQQVECGPALGLGSGTRNATKLAWSI